jgi:hypothetical protein
VVVHQDRSQPCRFYLSRINLGQGPLNFIRTGETRIQSAKSRMIGRAPSPILLLSCFASFFSRPCQARPVVGLYKKPGLNRCLARRPSSQSMATGTEATDQPGVFCWRGTLKLFLATAPKRLAAFSGSSHFRRPIGAMSEGLDRRRYRIRHGGWVPPGLQKQQGRADLELLVLAGRPRRDFMHLGHQADPGCRRSGHF